MTQSEMAQVAPYSLQWLAAKQPPLVLYGLGSTSIPKIFHTLLRCYNVTTLAAVVDKDPAKWGTEYKGTPVISPDEARSLGGGAVAVIGAWDETVIASIKRDAERQGLIAIPFRDMIRLTLESIFLQNKIEGNVWNRRD